MTRFGGRNDGHRDVVLTFDDGPNPRTTPALLDILARNDIKAMFFCVGQNLATKEGAQIGRRIQAEGHILANHSYTHTSLRGLPKDKVRDELQRTHDLICECAGGCKYFRPPYGASSATVSEVVLALGYAPILWNVDTLDWKLKKDGAWVEHAMEQIKVREDSIVLMHDIHKTTVDHVEPLIRRLRRIVGSRFVLY